MKQNSFKAFWLICMAAVAVSFAFGDDSAVQLDTKILESFDGDSGYTWQIQGSKYASVIGDDVYPKLTYVSTWPTQVFGQNEDGQELKSLGVWGKFDRRGYNWVDIYPSGGEGEDAGTPAKIPMPGRSQMIDVWVWGSNLNYQLEAYVEDYRGIVHTIPMGSINYTGWKNLKANIPATIPQSKRVLPRLASLQFVKFRIWTGPREPVDNFYVYFDQLKLLTDTFESKYDGEELADPAKIEEFWSGGNN
jgi:hypothetical protein